MEVKAKQRGKDNVKVWYDMGRQGKGKISRGKADKGKEIKGKMGKVRRVGLGKPR